jgi:hypothetical protein
MHENNLGLRGFYAPTPSIQVTLFESTTRGASVRRTRWEPGVHERQRRRLVRRGAPAPRLSPKRAPRSRNPARFVNISSARATSLAQPQRLHEAQVRPAPPTPLHPLEFERCIPHVSKPRSIRSVVKDRTHHACRFLYTHIAPRIIRLVLHARRFSRLVATFPQSFRADRCALSGCSSQRS